MKSESESESVSETESESERAALTWGAYGPWFSTFTPRWSWVSTFIFTLTFTRRWSWVSTFTFTLTRRLQAAQRIRGAQAHGLERGQQPGDQPEAEGEGDAEEQIAVR